MLTIVIAFTLTSCSEDEDNDIIPTENTESSGTPTVSTSPIYNVNFEANITYAEGLSHESLNSTTASTIPLLLDVYTPINESNNRPLFMFIHGGAFANGSKQQFAITEIGDFYASRGWVFVSIDYRLLGDKGTVPVEWAEFAESLPVSENDKASFNAMYPAQRDAKAALRWIIANSETYGINTDYITVGGASAGANTAKAIAVSEAADFTGEISIEVDPTLASTNLDQTYEIQTIIDFWGGQGVTDGFEAIYGRDLFDSQDPVLYKAHGTSDFTVPFTSALELLSIYESIGVTMELDTLMDVGHGDFEATLNGKRLEELAFDFIVSEQSLVVE